MRSSVFASWVRAFKFQSHVVVPGFVSLGLISLYFSTSATLQNLIAPAMDDVQRYSWREFGLLELLQNFLLLAVLFYGTRCLLASSVGAVKTVAATLLIGAAFILLEEIDYGAHFVEFFTGTPQPLAADGWNRNLHNRTLARGEQIGSYIKLAGRVIILTGFVLLPLIAGNSRSRNIRLLVPSKWAIATVAVGVFASRLAHWLDDQGFGTINGAPGNLEYNISEFGELNMYYLFLVYLAVLHERIIIRERAESERHHARP